MKMNDMLPLILDVINSGGSFEFYPRGISMLPTVMEGRDSVFLDKPGEIKKYDMALYKRDNGQYVLHRIVGKRHGNFIMRGDSQVENEYGVKSEDVIAIVGRFYHDGTLISRGERQYYMSFWHNHIIVPLKRIKYHIFNRTN